MRFTVTHTTQYKYSQPASESFAELRIWPQDTPEQKVLERELKIDPWTPVDHYEDYFGNKVEFFSIPYRHSELSVSSVAVVETHPGPNLDAVLETPLGDARQILNGQLYQLFEFRQPTAKVPLTGLDLKNNKPFFKEADDIGECLLRLNTWIYKNFSYTPGATDISTPLPKVLETRKGVCQDFAHLMLAILRSNGLAARYVSGYIEAFDPEKSDNALIGAAASHAWVEVYLPGEHWIGFDPTNNQIVGERHVKVATGRDYDDVAPMRGTFKGAQDQRLQVMVSLERMKRAEDKFHDSVDDIQTVTTK
ncbi:transglutaminase family protein [Rubellicoccus peritrichatus]|uniref:Transglutaminase family protein n=1 Tax=Rubellicoccus peritrichatus TaxID=3080537 RepID=A0AAQ3LA62_9BACT|nr:transglutaminase family protein [Puniceicoccus sp. CR14]WOO42494.1 transglutaminase family protein [Puniceicoccus sp. CR14]